MSTAIPCKEFELCPVCRPARMSSVRVTKCVRSCSRSRRGRVAPCAPAAGPTAPWCMQCAKNDLQHEHPVPRDGLERCRHWLRHDECAHCHWTTDPFRLLLKEWSLALKPSTTREKRQTTLCTTWTAPRVGRCTTTSRPWAPQVEWHTSRVAQNGACQHNSCGGAPARRHVPSTPVIPCWTVLEAPEEYTPFSGEAPATDLPCSLWPLSYKVVHLRREAWGDSVGKRPVLRARVATRRRCCSWHVVALTTVLLTRASTSMNWRWRI